MNRQTHNVIKLPGMGQIPVDSLPDDIMDKFNDLPLVEGEREEISKEERKRRTKKKKAIKKQKRKNR